MVSTSHLWPAPFSLSCQFRIVPSIDSYRTSLGALAFASIWSQVGRVAKDCLRLIDYIEGIISGDRLFLSVAALSEALVLVVSRPN